MLFQRIQDRFCAAVLIAGVKGEVKYFLIGVAGVVCIVFFQFLHGGVSGRRLAVLLEAQSPVPLCQGGERDAGSSGRHAFAGVF